MANVYSFIDSSGVIVADAAEIQTQVQNEYNAVFGADFNTNYANTPQGLLINAETQARIAVADNNATLANQINPNYAGGVFLDAILALLGAQRNAQSYTTVTATLTGIPGTSIPSGSQAKDTNGNLWQLISTTVIPSPSNSINTAFQAVEPGPIMVAPGELSIIVSAVLGWETITNAAASNLPGGQLTQSDASARQYRLNTLFLQGNSLSGAVIAGLYATNGVTSLTFLENATNAPATISGVTMVAHSIYVCVAGGTDQDVAATLTATKSGGCAYNNGASGTPVSVAYSVPLSGQVINVLFDRPDEVPIKVEITVTINVPVQDPTVSIQNAILNYFAGQVSGLNQVGVGQSVSPFEIAAAVGIQYPGIYVSDCQVATYPSGSFSPSELAIDKWQIATLMAAHITVNIS